MRSTIWLAAIVIALTTGCDREARVPEPKVPEKAQLPAINERIEREAEEGTRTGAPPRARESDQEKQPLLDRDTGR